MRAGSPSRPARAVGRGAAPLLALLAAGCAARSLPPTPEVAARARQAPLYSAQLRASLRGPELRARTPVLVAFRRPDALRVEVPGPAGLRLVAVARDATLTAVFPGERAVFVGPATASGLGSLLGVALEPAELMDLLVGAASQRLRELRLEWGSALPRRIVAVLPDGARLDLRVEDAELPAELPAAAFTPPPHEGYRRVDAEQARRLWSR
jgi:hypothetical protein